MEGDLPSGPIISVFMWSVKLTPFGRYHTIAYMLSITLLKFLIESELGSRRKLADAIKQGKVQVNGLIAENFKQEINPLKDNVVFDGQKVQSTKTGPVCLMMNKPTDVITTTSDEKGRINVLDLLPFKYKSMRLYPVGRLDRDSTGLLLLTNDGDLTYYLTHPKFEREKEYLVAVRGSLKQREKQKLEKGIELSDGKTSPAQLRGVRNRPPFKYSVTIHEGRNRQVRRMFEKLGYEVRELKRVRVGNLRLGNLKEGKVRELTPEEIEGLLSHSD